MAFVWMVTTTAEEGDCSMPFTEEELAYLRSQPLARVATLGDDEQPDVVPLAFEFDGTYFWVGGSGPTVAGTRKFRNIEAGHQKVALVIGDTWYAPTRTVHQTNH
jgi:pyridoxamine 5'-phosphate oxidase family protein